MKRLLSLILAAICLCAAAPAALAAGQVYRLPDLNMAIVAPEGWIVFTQDIAEDDPNLELIGMDSKELMDFLKENNIYIDMISTDPYADISVKMNESYFSRDIYDFNSIPDEDIPSVMESSVKEAEEQTGGQFTYSDCSVYTQQQAKFAVYDFTDIKNDATIYGKQYFTVLNGQSISITLCSYKGEISDELALTVRVIVDSVFFTEVTTKPDKLSAALSLVMDIAVLGGLVWLIAYIVRRGKKKKSPLGLDG